MRRRDWNRIESNRITVTETRIESHRISCDGNRIESNQITGRRDWNRIESNQITITETRIESYRINGHTRNHTNVNCTTNANNPAMVLATRIEKRCDGNQIESDRRDGLATHCRIESGTLRRESNRIESLRLSCDALSNRIGCPTTALRLESNRIGDSATGIESNRIAATASRRDSESNRIGSSWAMHPILCWHSAVLT